MNMHFKNYWVKNYLFYIIIIANEIESQLWLPYKDQPCQKLLCGNSTVHSSYFGWKCYQNFILGDPSESGRWGARGAPTCHRIGLPSSQCAYRMNNWQVYAKTFGGRQVARMSWVPQRHWEFPCYSHTRDVIGPVFQPDCRLVAVTLPQSGINDEKKTLSL